MHRGHSEVSSRGRMRRLLVRLLLLAAMGPQPALAFTNAKLNGPFTAIDGDVTSFQISPDSTWAVYLADQDTNGVREIYSAKLDGSGTSVKLNGALVGGGNVTAFLISPDSSRVVYYADQDVNGRTELYSRPIDGSGSAVKVNVNQRAACVSRVPDHPRQHARGLSRPAGRKPASSNSTAVPSTAQAAL